MVSSDTDHTNTLHQARAMWMWINYSILIICKSNFTAVNKEQVLETYLHVSRSSRFPKIDRLPIHCVLVKVYFDPLFQHKLYQIYQVYQVTYNWELTTQLDKIILKQTNGMCFNVTEEHDTGRHTSPAHWHWHTYRSPFNWLRITKFIEYSKHPSESRTLDLDDCS